MLPETGLSAGGRSRLGDVLPNLTGIAGDKRAAALGMLGSLALTAPVIVAFISQLSAVTPKSSDYFVHYCVSRLVLAGHGAAIYDPNTLGHIERSLAYPLTVVGQFLPNPLPPWFALVLVPFAVVPYSVGFLLWFALNLVLLAASLYALERYAGLGWRGRIVTRQLTLVSLPVVVTLLQGQMSLILLAALSVTFFMSRAGRDVPAGIALAFVLLKPQFVPPFLLLFLLRGRWGVLAGFAATTAALALLPMPILGAGISGAYIHTLREATTWGAGVGGFAPALNRSFAGFAQLLLPGRGGAILTGALDLAALALLARASRRSVPIDLAFALAAVVSLLVSGHVLIHGLCALLIPAAVLLRYRSELRIPAARLLMVLYLAILVGVPLAMDTKLQLPTLVMAAIGLYLVSVIERAHRQSRAVTDTLEIRDGLAAGPQPAARDRLPAST